MNIKGEKSPTYSGGKSMGWYRNGMLVAETKGDIIKYMECEGVLTGAMVEYFTGKYKYEDVVRWMMESDVKISWSSVLDEFMEEEVIEGEDMDIGTCILEWRYPYVPIKV